jgi:glycosyltransferase involved in cell wall biosynthesis
VKPVILILLGAYWPGHESTGPNMSMRAMCEALSDSFDFRIVARDRALDDPTQLGSHGTWHDAGYAQIRYLPIGPGRAGAIGLSKLLRDTPHNILWSNGFFDREFTIPALIARRLNRLPSRPMILSPRGEFSSGALGLKALRKTVYRRAATLLGLTRGIVFHVTSDQEESDVRAALPRNPILRLTNFRPLFALPPHQPRTAGAPLRAAFLGRISPVKGLALALDALAETSVPVDYTVYGPISERGYWEECQAKIAALPGHIRVTHVGELANDAVAAAMAAQDVLFLPSHSENFGHAIFESLCAGTPVLIGDHTPWHDLEAQRAGYDLPLGDPARFARALERLHALDGATAAQWRAGARAVAERFVRTSTAMVDTTRELSRLAAI